MMSKIFNTTLHNFGKVKKGKRVQTVISVLNDLKIKSVSMSCGCMTAAITGDKNILVSYKGEAVPRHLKYKNSYKIAKTATILLEDGSRHTIKFIAENYE